MERARLALAEVSAVLGMEDGVVGTMLTDAQR